MQKHLFFRGKAGFLLLKTKNKNTKRRQKNKPSKKKLNKRPKKGGFRAKWSGPSGHLTWPLNPPQKTKNEKTRNTKEYQKMSFSVISQNFYFVLSTKPFLITWPKKRAPKNTKNRDFSKPISENNLTVTKRPCWTKTTQNPKFQIFSVAFSFLLTTTGTNVC